MTDARAQSNPFSPAPGPELNVRTHLHGLFEANVNKPGWSPDFWDAWTDQEVADTIRAVARDYQADHGRGFDVMSAAAHAEFVFSSLYNDLTLGASDDLPPLVVNFYDPIVDEGFELVASRPSTVRLSPVPGAAPTPVNENSARARASMDLPPAFDAHFSHPAALLQGAVGISEYIGAKNRFPLQMMGACLAMWRGLQVSHTVRAGAIYRGIHDPKQPDRPKGDVRLVYGRGGDYVLRALEADPAGGQFFLD